MIAGTITSQSPGRGWTIFCGAVLLVLGALAMALPVPFSKFLTQLFGALLLVGGAAALASAIFGKHKDHRILTALSGLVRIAAGVVIFACTTSGMLALTLVLAVAFLAEGVICIITSLRLRGNPAWVWLLLNGIAALVLGGMIYMHWPFDAAWVIGLLFGIQSIFGGVSLLMLGLAPHRPAGI